MEHWLRTDERQEFISSMRMVLQGLNSVGNDLEQWKWVVIALHNSVQGAMVMSLRAGNDFRIMPNKLAEKCYKAHRENNPWPKIKMDSFNNLYEKVKSHEMMCFLTISKPLGPSEARDYSINKLLELRNSFIHFMPQGWSLELSGMPTICIQLLEMIHFLCWECGNITWYEEAESEEAKRLVSESIAVANTLSVEYAN